MISFWITQSIGKPELVFAWTKPQDVNDAWRCQEVQLTMKDAVELMLHFTQQMQKQLPDEKTQNPDASDRPVRHL